MYVFIVVFLTKLMLTDSYSLINPFAASLRVLGDLSNPIVLPLAPEHRARL